MLGTGGFHLTDKLAIPVLARTLVLKGFFGLVAKASATLLFPALFDEFEFCFEFFDSSLKTFDFSGVDLGGSLGWGGVGLGSGWGGIGRLGGE